MLRKTLTLGEDKYTVQGFDSRGHLNSKDLKKLFRNFELNDDLYQSRHFRKTDLSLPTEGNDLWAMSKMACIHTMAQISLTKSIIVPLKWDILLDRKYYSISINVWDEDNGDAFVTGIDLWSCKLVDKYKQRNTDFIYAFKATGGTSWGT